MGRLIAISNRTAADPSARAGGLAVAVWDSLTSTGGMWFGWSGNIVEEVGPPDHIEDEGVEFVVTDFTEAEHEGFYLQYANRVIWPVFHYRVDLAHFGDTISTPMRGSTGGLRRWCSRISKAATASGCMTITSC